MSSARIRTLAEGEVWTEWVDLAMYCSGRALPALVDGADVEAHYGFRRANRRDWVARRPGSDVREWIGGVDVELFFPGVEPETETRRIDAPDDEGPAPIEISLHSMSAARASRPIFRVALRAREGTERIYGRPDAWSFEVDGPLGRVVCRLPAGGGSPPPDLYRRVSRRAAYREALDGRLFCPADTFAQAGVYRVTPRIHLRHDGAEWGFDAVTGRFRGPSALVRVTHGSEGYVEQTPPEPPDGRAPEGGDE